MPTFNSRIGNSSISNDGGCKYSDADLDQSSDSNSDEFEIVDSINDGTCESTGDEFECDSNSDDIDESDCGLVIKLILSVNPLLLLLQLVFFIGF